MADSPDKPEAPVIVQDTSVLPKKRRGRPPGSGRKKGSIAKPTYNNPPPGSPEPIWKPAGAVNRRIPMDAEGVRRLAARFWSPAEIGAFYGVSRVTILKRFPAELAEGRQSGRAHIRDLQWHAAQEGSEKVLIHMSQQHLQEHPQSSLKIEQLPAEQLVKAIESKLLEDAEARKLLSGETEDSAEEDEDVNTETPSSSDPEGT